MRVSRDMWGHLWPPVAVFKRIASFHRGLRLSETEPCVTGDYVQRRHLRQATSQGPTQHAGHNRRWTEALVLFFFFSLWNNSSRWPRVVPETQGQKMILSFLVFTYGELCFGGLHLLTRVPFCRPLHDAHFPGVGNSKLLLD